MARRRSRAPKRAATPPVNWPLAVGAVAVAGGVAYYLVKVRPAAAATAALQAILPGPIPLPAPPPQSTPNPLPTNPPPPPPSSTLPPVPAGALRATISNPEIRAIQASFNLLGRCGCRTLVVNGVWNPDTEDAFRCYLRKLNVSQGRPPEPTAAQMDALTPYLAETFITALRTVIPALILNVPACNQP